MYPYIYIIVPSYALFASVGMFFALLLLRGRIDKYKVDIRDFIKLIVCSAVCLLVGSKFLFVITLIPRFVEASSISEIINSILQSGFVFYGGLLGMLIGISFWVKRSQKYNLDTIYNMMAPAIPLFHAFGRMGCFMTGCCYGKELKTPIAVGNAIKLVRFPTQLLEVVFECIMFVILLIFERKGNQKLLWIYLLCYSLFRFVIEFFRGDEIRGIFGGLSTSQWISIIIFIVILKKTMIRRKSLCQQ
ncbi:MAG: prolipoprotein diacylglyceryl transferase [Lachnospiraceae bacterium]|nr:prolipoprotein diacylglyceryl transferase [Lachnospiraceae bacterium]